MLKHGFVIIKRFANLVEMIVGTELRVEFGDVGGEKERQM